MRYFESTWSHTWVSGTHSVVVCAVDVPGHAEISDLDQQVFPDQAVPGGQVPVDKVLGGQVDHAGGDLLGDVQHLGLGELHRDAVLAIHDEHGVGTVGPVHRQVRVKGSEGSVRVPPVAWLDSPEELVQVSVFHVLKDHDERVALHAHAVEGDDVLVLQVGEELRLSVEVRPAAFVGFFQGLDRGHGHEEQ